MHSEQNSNPPISTMIGTWYRDLRQERHRTKLSVRSLLFASSNLRPISARCAARFDLSGMLYSLRVAHRARDVGTVAIARALTPAVRPPWTVAVPFANPCNPVARRAICRAEVRAVLAFGGRFLFHPGHDGGSRGRKKRGEPSPYLERDAAPEGSSIAISGQ